MSRRREAGRWEPSDGAEVNRQGVPLALTTYQLVSAGERGFFAHLCTLADLEGVVTDISQEQLARARQVNRATIIRWIAKLMRLRMLWAVQLDHYGLAVYTLRPPSGWISERMTGLALPEELEAQLGPPVTREQLDAWRAADRVTSEGPDATRS